MKFIGSLTIGQFIPIDSIIHSLDPRTKLIGLFMCMLLLFLFPLLKVYIFLAVVFHLFLFLSNLKYRLIFNGIKPIMFLILITAFFNLFFTPGEKLWWIISKEGLYKGTLFSLRIYLLVFLSSLLTYTTSPLRLTDSMEYFMKPLKSLKVPVEDISLMLVIALRFIPTIVNEIDRLIKAQKSRGVEFEKGNLIKRIKKLLPVFLPLFISLFKRADELAEAMESRCFVSGEHRTKRQKLSYSRRDLASFVVLFFVGISSYFIFSYA